MLTKLKKIYWSLCEWHFIQKAIAHDYFEQIQVLFIFFLLSFNKKSFVNYDKNNRNILFVSYYSSPYKSARGTQRLGKFIKYLNKLGWNISLLSTTPSNNEEIAPEAEAFPDNVKIYRLPQIVPKGLTGRKRKRLIPDYCINWIRPAVQAIDDISTRENYALICSTVPPYSNAMVGTIAAKKLGIPHVVDFRDPWSKIDFFWVLPKKWQRWISARIESRVLRICDAIVMADEIKYAPDFFSISSPHVLKKITSILNGFDISDIEPLISKPSKDSNKFIISYVGIFYNQETADAIIKPLILWYKKYPTDFDKVQFEYAGPSSSYFDQSDFRPKWFIDYQYVSHKDAISIRSRSSLQIFAQPSNFKPHVLTGKIYEMIAIDVPILALTNPDGAASELIKRTATGFVCRQNDFEHTAIVLKQLFDQWQSGTLKTQRNEYEINKLTRESLAQKLSLVFDDVIQDWPKDKHYG